VILLPGGASNGAEIFLGCPTNPSTCRGGTLHGFRDWWYAATYTFPYKCNYWTFGHAESARNSIANFPGGGNLYVEATFDNLHAQGNSSAYLSVPPTPMVCDNVQSSYNAGAQDPNNDSLGLEIIAPRSGSDCAPTSMTFGSGFSLSSYFGGSSFSFNDTTGQMNFTPSATGQYALAERVNEYRYIPGSGMTKISSVMRDMEIIVLPCSNKQPTLSTISGSISGATLTGGILNTCTESTISFCFDMISPDTNSVLVPADNSYAFFTSSFPSVRYTHVYTDSVRGCFLWTPRVYDTGLRIFCVSLKDSGCKGLGIAYSNTYSIPIYVHSSIKASASKLAICRGDSVKLSVSGGSSFIWSAVPGGSLASSLSCTACSNPVAKPVFTTSYVASNASITACKNMDTVTVAVSAMPAKPTITTDSILCAGDSLKLSEIETTAGVTYKWSGPSGYSSTLASPTILFPTQGKYKLTVANGACAVADSFNLKIVAVSPSPSVYVTTIPPGDKYTAGDYVLFTANAANTVPSTTYQWERNGIVITGATNSKYLTNTLSEHDVITVLVRNNMPCSGVDSAIGTTFPLTVTEPNNSDGIKIFPNPNTGSFVVSGPVSVPTVEIQVINIVGQTVYKHAVVVVNGRINEELHLENLLANGSYILRVLTETTNSNINFIISK